MNNMRKIFLLLLITCLTFLLNGQITVSYPNGQTPQQLIINQLSGAGVQLTNGQFNRSSTALTGQNLKIGTFSNGTSFTDFPFNSGIIMTTGNISVANSPNSSTSSSSSISDGVAIDNNLQALVSYTLNGATILEFDFRAVSPSFSFEYVFASEEYPEYVCSNFNDVFAFFLTGLDPVTFATTTKNIALIPNTNTIVAINSVNGYPNGTTYPASGCISTNYNQFYTNTPSGGGMGFDGYTVMRENNSTTGAIISGLIATGNIVQCQSYHMKLSIANVSDGSYDSGVFLKQGSFTSPEIEYTNNFSFEENDTLIAGCNEVEIDFSVNIESNTRNYPLTLSTDAIPSTAVLGEDYQLFYTTNAGDTVELTTTEANFNLRAGDESVPVFIKIPETATFPDNEIRVLNLLLTVELCNVAGYVDMPQDTLTFYLKNNHDIVIEPQSQLDFCGNCNEIGVVPVQGNPASYAWTPNHNIDHDDQQTTSANITNSTTYQVIASDPWECKTDTISFNVDIVAEPSVGFTMDKNDGCAPLTVNFTSTTTPINTDLMWVISTADTVIDTIYNETAFAYTFLQEGHYNVALYGETAPGCNDELIIENAIYAANFPTANFSWAPDIATNGRMISFYNHCTGENISSYLWQFGDGATSNLAEPSYAYHVNSDKNFNIRLMVTNSSGCSDDTLQTISVIDNYAFYVPSAFSPNNDGINDVFKPMVKDVFKYHLTIYNRFGECVFQTVNPEESWDGYYEEKLCQPGVYTYKISFIKYANLEEELTKEGSLTIVR